VNGESFGRLRDALRTGRFVVTGEIVPPRSSSGGDIQERVKLLRGYVDALNLADNPLGNVGMSSIAAAVHVRALGVEPIIQMTCRDRNRIALQSDLLGAYSLGLDNVLCLTGDHQSRGDHPSSRNVYDLDSVQLVQMVKGLDQQGRLLGGQQIVSSAPQFCVGAAANPSADPTEMQVLRLEKKINAGAEFIQTQPVLDMERFFTWIDLVRRRGLHRRAKIIVGVLAPGSATDLERLQTTSRLRVSDELFSRLGQSMDPRSAGIEWALDVATTLRSTEGVSGIHLAASHDIQGISAIVRGAGLYPRPE
jgi:methylenetetrahydrofolate reductase (NADPH)